jgi:EsV-like protein
MKKSPRPNGASKKCQTPGCKNKAYLGPKGGMADDAVSCSTHKQGGFVTLTHVRCVQEGCRAKPSFGPKRGTKKDAMTCGDHKIAGFIDLLSKNCSHEGCTRHASYGVEGGKRETCVEHRKAHFVCLSSKQCARDGCEIKPSFGPKGGVAKDAVNCFKHKEDDHVNLLNKKCDHEDCQKTPSFGPENGTRNDAVTCAAHSDWPRINVTRSRARVVRLRRSHLRHNLLPLFFAHDKIFPINTSTVPLSSPIPASPTRQWAESRPLEKFPLTLTQPVNSPLLLATKHHSYLSSVPPKLSEFFIENASNTTYPPSTCLLNTRRFSSSTTC